VHFLFNMGKTSEHQLFSQALFLGEGNKALDHGHASSVGSFANIKMNGPEVYRFAVSAVPSVRACFGCTIVALWEWAWPVSFLEQVSALWWKMYVSLSWQMYVHFNLQALCLVYCFVCLDLGVVNSAICTRSLLSMGTRLEMILQAMTLPRPVQMYHHGVGTLCMWLACFK
jgi:hypothetical protein